MQGAPRLPLGVVTIVLLVAPGLIGLELYYRFSKKSNDLSRTRLLVYSAVVSLGSLVAMYAATPLYFDTVTGSPPTALGEIRLLSLVSGSVSLSEGMLLYGIHVAVAIVVGVGLGLFSDKVVYRGRDQEPRDPWVFGLEEQVGSDREIVVVLDDGSQFAGVYEEKLIASRENGLYIDNPRDITPPENTSQSTRQGERDSTEERQGVQGIDQLVGSAFFSPESIAGVFFVESDPQGDEAAESSESTRRRPDEADEETEMEQFSPEDTEVELVDADIPEADDQTDE